MGKTKGQPTGKQLTIDELRVLGRRVQKLRAQGYNFDQMKSVLNISRAYIRKSWDLIRQDEVLRKTMDLGANTVTAVTNRVSAILGVNGTTTLEPVKETEKVDPPFNNFKELEAKVSSDTAASKHCEVIKDAMIQNLLNMMVKYPEKAEVFMDAINVYKELQ